MKKGEIINDGNIISLRPNSGICASELEKFIGKCLTKNVCKYTALSFDHI